MKEIKTIVAIVGAFVSLYVGLYLMLICGIISLFQSHNITISILKILFAIPLTISIWFFSMLPIIHEIFGKKLLH